MCAYGLQYEKCTSGICENSKQKACPPGKICNGSTVKSRCEDAGTFASYKFEPGVICSSFIEGETYTHANVDDVFAFTQQQCNKEGDKCIGFEIEKSTYSSNRHQTLYTSKLCTSKRTIGEQNSTFITNKH